MHIDMCMIDKYAFGTFFLIIANNPICCLQQPREPRFVGLAVQSGATILSKEGKCKSSY